MKRNESNFDRIFRVILGLGVIVLGAVFGSWWGALGLVFVITGAVGYCPLYTLLGFSTCPVHTQRRS